MENINIWRGGESGEGKLMRVTFWNFLEVVIVRGGDVKDACAVLCWVTWCGNDRHVGLLMWPAHL
jgi:hypothetical protein